MQGLVARWGTRGAAKFRLKQAALHRCHEAPSTTVDQAALIEADFDQYEAEESRYAHAIEQLGEQLDVGLPITKVPRQHLPNFDFRGTLVVVVVGPDGLVANAAKYVGDLPIIGVNPDPTRNDGILAPFRPNQVRRGLLNIMSGKEQSSPVTLAEATLNDGQRMLAFNDLFIGRRTHVSARYNLRWTNRAEPQSSSGVLVATGAGSTGWLSSVFNMTRRVNKWAGGTARNPPPLRWQDRQLAWVVREPFVSRHSSAELVTGMIEDGQSLVIESLMPEHGVIFSDGIEEDFLEFNSGATATISVASQQAKLVMPIK